MLCRSTGFLYIRCFFLKCKYPQIFDRRKPDVAFPCGQCQHCRFNNRRVLTNRILCERECHEHNSFLTLTYADEFLPDEFVLPTTGQIYAPLSVSPLHHNLFKHRLQVYSQRKLGLKVRYFGVGEYGDKTERPHYHYALFGLPHCPYGGGRVVARRYQPCVCPICSHLQSCWPFGHVHLGKLEHDSAQYIAGYVTKKMTSERTEFQRDFLQGRFPEFMRSSRDPGIGGLYIPILADALRPYMPFTVDNVPRVLSHGPKLLPLGRYMQDKLYAALGVSFADGEKLSLYKASLRALFKDNPYASSEVQALASSPTSHSLGIALEMLNAQSSINLAARLKLFSKEKSL